jgi:hypothetical protein
VLIHQVTALSSVRFDRLFICPPPCLCVIAGFGVDPSKEGPRSAIHKCSARGAVASAYSIGYLPETGVPPPSQRTYSERVRPRPRVGHSLSLRAADQAASSSAAS